MFASDVLWIIKDARFEVHLIQPRLMLKRLFHSLVFAWETSASTLSSAATTSGVKLVQWSLLGAHGGNIDGEVTLTQCLVCKKRVLKSHPLSWNAKHTCGPRAVRSHALLSPSFSPFSLRDTSVSSHVQVCTTRSRWAKPDVGSVFGTGSWFGRVTRLDFLRGRWVRES